jgi:pilus assembly protein FimV
MDTHEDTGTGDALDLEIEDTFEMPKGGGADEEEDMLKTVEIPGKKGGEEDEDEDEDGGDATLFVPRSANTEEQSAEDEIATKLDLAKAYVELGDKDSAKSILEDIIAEGNDEQRQQAQEMMNQVS